MRYWIDAGAFHNTDGFHRLCGQAPAPPERHEGCAIAALDGLNLSGDDCELARRHRAPDEIFHLGCHAVTVNIPPCPGMP
jgi:hypothetical protein